MGRGTTTRRRIRNWAVSTVGLLAMLMLLVAGLVAGLRPPVAQSAPTQRFVATTGGDSIANNGGSPFPNDCTEQNGNPPCKTIAHAVSEANAGDPIQVAAGLYCEQVTISKNLTITGAGAGSTLVDGQGAGTTCAAPVPGNVFTILGATTVTLQSLTIQHGCALSQFPSCTSGASADGGGINNAGALTLSSVTLSNNSAPNGNGGGIANSSTLTMTGVSLTGNTANLEGGGIVNSGTINPSTVTLSNNSATCNGECGPEGGAVFNSGTLTFNNSTLSNNSAHCGGACTPEGGGIYNSGGATLNNSTLNNNSTGCDVSDCFSEGGGIFNQGIAQFFARASARPDVPCLFGRSQPAAGCGGSALSLTNVTLNANSSTCPSVFCTADGGAIFNGGTATLTTITMAGNSVTCTGSPCTATAGGIDTTGGTANLQASILAANTGGDCSGTVTSGGFNVTDDATCGLAAQGQPGDVESSPTLAADLGPLAANGGPVATMALLPGSPAIDHFPTNTCLAAFAALVPPLAATDARGITRPQGPACDSGAFELVPVPAPGGGPLPTLVPQVLNLIVTPNPTTTGARATYTVAFTSSPSGVLGAGSAITLVAPNGTDFPSTPPSYSISATNGHTATISSVAVSQANGSNTNSRLVLTLGSANIAAEDRVTITIQGVLNPPAGTDTANLSTSADTIVDTSAPYVITPVSATPTASPTPTPGCATVTYGTGWNLAGGPTGTVLTGAAALFTHQASDPASGSAFYRAVGNTLTAPQGVWAFYFSPTAITQPCVSGASVTVTLPAGNSIMVGNPFNRPAAITGTATPTWALTFNTASNTFGTWMQVGPGQSLSLAIGQGAFVFASGGSTLTITST